jgi:hypothetical protein
VPSGQKATPDRFPQEGVASVTAAAGLTMTVICQADATEMPVAPQPTEK